MPTSPNNTLVLVETFAVPIGKGFDNVETAIASALVKIDKQKKKGKEVFVVISWLGDNGQKHTRRFGSDGELFCQSTTTHSNHPFTGQDDNLDLDLDLNLNNTK